MAERDNRRRRPAGAAGGSGKGKRRTDQRAGGGGRGGGQPRQSRDRDGGGAPAPRPARTHNMTLEVGGHGIELHCDTCGLVVTHLAAPQVRRAVEEAHRRHLGTLTWESAWVAICTCGWTSGRLSQDAARRSLDDHEASVLLPAARGEPGPG